VAAEPCQTAKAAALGMQLELCRCTPCSAAARARLSHGWSSTVAAVWSVNLLCCVVLCCAVLCCAVLRCAVLCCAVLCCDTRRSMGFSGTILRSNLHESRELVRLPDVRTAVQLAGLIIWPWVSSRWTHHVPQGRLSTFAAAQEA
jgi:hypothetical protein